MHVDYNVSDNGINIPTVFAIESSRVTELRGSSSSDKVLRGHEYYQFMEYVGHEAEHGCLLDILFQEYLRLEISRTYPSFPAFLIYILGDVAEAVQRYNQLVAIVKDSPSFPNDLLMIKESVLALELTIPR
jgi:hypothetical protein